VFPGFLYDDDDDDDDAAADDDDVASSWMFHTKSSCFGQVESLHT
jgi:hypothetical protein